MQLSLSLATLGACDHGLVEAIIDDALSKACKDLAERGMGQLGDGKPREVNIKVILTDNRSGYVRIEVEASCKMPVTRTRPTLATIKQRGENAPAELLFRDTSPADPRQTTIEDHSKSE